MEVPRALPVELHNYPPMLYPARHCVPGKLFDKLKAVSGSIRLTAMSLPNGSVERPRRACPVLTGWAGSFIVGI